MLLVTPTSPPAADALEQRDPWRNVWQAATSDGLLLALCVIAALALAAGALLPQSPAGGTADPLAYSQWQSQARALTGRLYDLLSALGLFQAAQAFWLRAATVALTAVVLLRLADRTARLWQAARSSASVLRDEERLRVTDQAPPLAQIAERLRAQRYRVALSDAGAPTGWLTADRAPWAESASILLHAGLLLVAVGMLLNGALGWEVARQQVDTESAVTLPLAPLSMQLQSADSARGAAVLRLPDEQRSVPLLLEQQTDAPWLGSLPLPCCLSLRLVEITPGFRVSAQDAAGTPLTITTSSYADPVSEALLTFRRDEPQRLVGVEQAQLAVLVLDADGGSVQVYSIPSGQVLTATQARASIVISDTTLRFGPTTGAVVSAHYRPGQLALLIGGALALLGLLAALAYPMQRLVIRHDGYWTEFYASGRGTRRMVRALMEIGD